MINLDDICISRAGLSVSLYYNTVGFENIGFDKRDHPGYMI